MKTNRDMDEINSDKYPFDAGIFDFLNVLNEDLADGVLLVDLPEHLELYNRYCVEGQGLNGNGLCMVEGWDFAYTSDDECVGGSRSGLISNKLPCTHEIAVSSEVPRTGPSKRTSSFNWLRERPRG